MLLIALAAATFGAAPGAKPIDFATVPRTLKKEPTYLAEPRYGMFLFGAEADTPVFCVLDKSAKTATGYDVLYIDRDADGVLGEEGERLAGETKGAQVEFAIGDFTQPGTTGDAAVVHTDFKITWTKESVRFRMQWAGETLTMGGFGPTRATYAGFAASAADATIFVPGYDRPLEFEHWMSGELIAGETKDFKVFLGARGSVTGAFSCGDQKLLPKGEYVLATLHYTAEGGQQKTVRAKLRERC